MVPVNLIIVTLFRKAKSKPGKLFHSTSTHVVRQKYWRKVQVVESIDLNENRSETQIDKIANENTSLPYEESM